MDSIKRFFGKIIAGICSIWHALMDKTAGFRAKVGGFFSSIFNFCAKYVLIAVSAVCYALRIAFSSVVAFLRKIKLLPEQDKIDERRKKRTQRRNDSYDDVIDNEERDNAHGTTSEGSSMFDEKGRRKSIALGVLFTTLKILLITFAVGGAVGFGLVLGIAKAYIDTTPMLELSALTDASKTSYLYDSDGEVITTFAGAEYREWADIDEIPDMLKNAVVAIEDVRFYKHDGVDYKRLISAIINTFRNQDTHGGSTITQQLIKNTILTNVQSYKRKIQEAYLALELESVSNKDAILEAYLNQVFLGDQNYGVKSAAQDYFGKELNELTIRECAMLAGMVQKPNGYNPRLNTYVRKDPTTGENYMYRTNDRTDLVIKSMYDAGFITMEQKQSALTDTVNIVEESNKTDMYEMAYFVEYAIQDVITHLIEQRGMPDTSSNRLIVENELRSGGYHIYLTVDSEIQKIVESELENYDNYPKLKKESASELVQENSDGTTTTTIEPQAAAVVFDHNSGNLVAIVGGRTKPTQKRAWNRAYMSYLEVGSSIKPIAVYGPALDTGMSPASIIYNIPGKIDGWNTANGYPSMGGSEMNPVTMRRGIRSSLNVVAARTLMEFVGLETSKEYMMNLGIDEEHINVDGPGLALGTTGITPIQMAAAYGTIANEGVYNEPLSFSKVVDSNGRTILDAEQIRESRRVFKESTAYLLVDMMEGVVQSGTGTRAQINNMTVAGKTGTNSDYSSVCFSGMTPYYTATVWIGHDYPQNVLAGSASGGRYAAPLWKNFMQKIHEGLEDRKIIDETPSSLGLVSRTVCSVSGLLATEACHADALHSPVTDWFVKEDAPKESCDMHVCLECCAETGDVATEYCGNRILTSLLLIRSDSPYMQFDIDILNQLFPNAIFTDESIDTYAGEGHYCTEHSANNNGAKLNELINEAQALIKEVEDYLAAPNSLTDSQENDLVQTISYLRLAIRVRSRSYIMIYMERLSSYFNDYTGG